ncbi:TPA: hypothetical protein N0F65_004138, partial [Lagenidium giganteum]
VEELQQNIVSTEQHTVPPRLLKLNLARKKEGKNDVWLADNANLDALLQGDVGAAHKKMRPSWKLNKKELFGPSFTLGDEEIHVLVERPVLSEAELSQDRQLVVGGVHVPITQSMSLNSPALVAFWQAFLNDRTEVKADALVKPPKGTYILGDSTLGSRIYILHCYPALWKLCLERIHDEETNTPHLVILGNPGIGKAFFGFVILLLLARAGATVVYESAGLKQRYLLTEKIVAEGLPNDFVQILKNPATWMPSSLHITQRRRFYWHRRVAPSSTSLKRPIVNPATCQCGPWRKF